MAELGLGQLRLLDLPEGELDRVVTVAVGLADRRHRTWAGLDDGDRDDRPVLPEDLGHPELLADNRAHR
jgi:hypothetical protein